jgi:alpha-L-fucosidase
MKQQDKYEWFINASYGMFIHWGIYSVLGRGEQVLFREHLKPSEYRQLAHVFNPAGYDPQAWASYAKKAGMKYMVLTAKHHDGFCLFDSSYTEYTAYKTAAKRDLVRSYTDACRAAGLRVGLYFTLADWNVPAYFDGPAKDPQGFDRFIRYVHAQVEELCRHYGKIDLLWFDADWPYSAEEWRSVELVDKIKKLQPDILINNRLPKPPEGGDWGYQTPEQKIEAAKGLWESCQTYGNNWWGYHIGDNMWKTPQKIVADLCKIAEGGGNLLFNVGPKPDGTLPQPYVDCILETGKWLEENGEAIYGAQPGICEVSSIGHMTIKGNKVYLLVLYWPGTEVHMSGLANKVLQARLLRDKSKLTFNQEGEHIYIKDLPAMPPDPYCTVIELETEGLPEAYPWVSQRLWSGHNISAYADWSRQ